MPLVSRNVTYPPCSDFPSHLCFSADTVGASEMWRGLVVAPENRCTRYNFDDYKYPRSVELQIIKEMGGNIYDPYTGRYFFSPRQTDIEHIVARSEAHDSGLCEENFATKTAFPETS